MGGCGDVCEKGLWRFRGYCMVKSCGGMRATVCGGDRKYYEVGWGGGSGDLEGRCCGGVGAAAEECRLLVTEKEDF